MGGLCGGGGSRSSSRSAGRGSGGGSSRASTVDKVTTDLKMGLSTFGLGKEAQAEKLREQGYSDSAIRSYQDRTAATQERLRQQSSSSRDDDRRRSPAPEPEPTPTPEPTPEPKPEVTVDDIPEPPAPVAEVPITPPSPPEPEAEGPSAPTRPDTGAGTTTAQGGREEAATLRAVAQGPAERRVADTVEAGRRSTIETTPQGLTTKAKTRRRRSMISGEELEEGL